MRHLLTRAAPLAVALTITGGAAAQSTATLHEPPTQTAPVGAGVEDVVDISLANGDTAFQDGVLAPGTEVTGSAVITRQPDRPGKAWVRMTADAHGVLMDNVNLTVTRDGNVLYDGPVASDPHVDLTVEQGVPARLSLTLSVPTDSDLPQDATGGAALTWTVSE